MQVPFEDSLAKQMSQLSWWLPLLHRNLHQESGRTCWNLCVL